MRLLQRKHRLEQRRTAGITHRLKPLHQKRKGIRLMLKSFENYFSYAAVELFEGGIARQISPQTIGLTKYPITLLNSARSRPALGEPTSRSSWREYRNSSAWKQASRVIYRVAPRAAPNSFSSSLSSSSNANGSAAPRYVCSAGRG